MLLWIILTLMTSVAAVWLATPLLARIDAARAASSNTLEVYRDQLAEVARERGEGLIEQDTADAAELEIKRRMLAAGRDQAGKSAVLSLGERHFAVVNLIGIVVLGSAILYSNTGRPDIDSVARAPTTLVLDQAQGSSFQPATGGAAPAIQPAAGSAPSAERPQAVAAPPSGGPAATAPGARPQPVGSLDEMIQRLVERLKKDPGQADTWRMLGWSYASTERHAEAADAYRKAVELQPTNAALLSSLGEAMVRSGDGQVKPDAVAIFDRALAADLKEPRARYFKGVVQEQSGDKRAALDSWIALLSDGKTEGKPDDPAMVELRGRVTKLASELGVDVAARLPAATAPAGSGILSALESDPAGAPAAPAPRGPSASAMKAAAAMSPADRTAMIRSMVDGLAARLEKSPRDGDGWLQLIRSRRVLGETDAARAALAKALDVFADTPQEQQRITAAAQELGVLP